MSNRNYNLFRTLSSTAARVAGESVLRKLNLPSETKAALRLTDGLDELKGLSMKFGQMVSLLPDEEILPRGWREELQRLQNSATPMPWNEIEPLLRKELPNYLDHFSEIDPHAVHSASIGQVHQGRLRNGIRVAVKIQYPGIEDSLESDLELMRGFLQVLKIFPNEARIDELLETVRQGFLQELDFEREGRFYELYYRAFAKETGILIPALVPSCCTKKLLTTHWMDGITLDDWIQAHGESSIGVFDRRNDLGYRFQKIFLKELFEMGVVQTDPNPANFLVTPDEELVLLDFGSAQLLPHRIVEGFRHLVRSSLCRNYREIERAGLELGFLHKEDSAHARTAFLKVIDIISETFLPKDYDWQQCGIAKRVHDETIHFTTSTRFRPPPPEVVFLNRRILGNQLIMEKLKPRLAFRSLVQEYLDLHPTSPDTVEVA